MTRWMLVLLLVLGMGTGVWASSVAQPPNEVREYLLTASDTSQNVKLSGYTACAIQVINDGATTVYISTKNTVSNAPTNGDKFFTVYAGESTAINLQYGQFSYITTAGGACAIRVRILSNN